MSETSTTPLDVSLARLSKPHLRGCLPTWRAVTLHLRADLHRYDGGGRYKFLRHFLFTPGYKYTVWMRICGYLKQGRLTRYTLYPFAKWWLVRCRYKYGIAIPEYTDIGPGLFINRFGGIYINGDAKIGSNVNIGQMSMLGQTNRGDHAGSPVIGSRVFVGVGSSVIGRVRVGDGAVVGVNSVVTKDVGSECVVGGTPAKVLSRHGSEGYINRPVPPDLVEACLAARSRA